MGGTVTLPGPENLILFGVQLKVLSLIFGMFGVGLGHLMTPTPGAGLSLRQHVAVIAAGQLVAIAITIAAGQRPLLVLGWCIGVGFTGLALYQIWGASTKAAAGRLGSAALDELTERLAARKDKP